MESRERGVKGEGEAFCLGSCRAGGSVSSEKGRRGGSEAGGVGKLAGSVFAGLLCLINTSMEMSSGQVNI